MRSDHINRHIKIHIVSTTVDQIENREEICKDIVMEILHKMFVPEDSASERKHDEEHFQPTMKRKHFDDYTENCTTPKRNDAQDQPDKKRKYEIDYEDLEKIMKEETHEFHRKIALGEAIEHILGKGEVKQAALSKDKQEALELYRNEDDDFYRYKDTVLYPWQEELLEKINEKSDRQVFWIVGEKTNEGKSYFQKYIKAMFGTSRVVSGINLKTGSKNICQSLRKHPLATADIFLFNLGKSKKNFENVNYEMLEALKDGDAFAEKYDSEKLKIKTPNVVMVFSNHFPETKELAIDRWKVFYIRDNHLEEKEAENQGYYHVFVPKKKKQVKKKESDSDSDY